MCVAVDGIATRSPAIVPVQGIAIDRSPSTCTLDGVAPGLLEGMLTRSGDDLVAEYVAARDGEFELEVGEIGQLEAEILGSYEGFLFQQARRWSRRGDEFLRDDLVQEGRIGLLAALRRFELGHGAKFLTYAAYVVRDRMSTWIAEQVPPVRVNRNTQRVARRANPDLRSDRRLPRFKRLGAPLFDDDVGFDVADPAASPEETLVAHEVAATLAAAVATLPERQRGLVVRHFGLSGEKRITQAAFAVEEGISRQRAKQIVDQALAHLRHRPEVLALAPIPEDAAKQPRGRACRGVTDPADPVRSAFPATLASRSRSSLPAARHRQLRTGPSSTSTGSPLKPRCAMLEPAGSACGAMKEAP